MTEAEVKRCREAFRMFDKDNSGTIDVWELAQALETSLKKKPTQEEVFGMISMVDEDMSGSIDFQEFLKVIQTQRAASTKLADDSDLVNAFVALGGAPDKSGTIDYAKLRKIIYDDFGLTFKLDEQLKQVSPDNNGGAITFNEFKDLLA
ncbi:EF-hand domain-containing protein [Plasmodiophora brassicae]|nr:hypothetical protein PBRA_000021 [Plasmodiophora brassicae]